MARRLELTAGGQKVPLNKFTRRIITDILLALLGNLKDFDCEAEIVLKLHRERMAGGPE